MKARTEGTILLVDDDEQNIFVYSRLLSDAGFRVHSSQTGKDILELLEAVAPDLVLLDVVLDAESGLDVLKTIKADPRFRHVFVVLITGKLTSSDDQASGLEIGADGYLLRPSEKREFLARIQAFMRHKRTLDSLRASEERLRKIIERNPDAILVVDRKGDIQFANPAAENLFALTVDELLSRVFGYPIVEGEHTEIQIFRRNSEAAVAEIRTIDIEWDNQISFLTSIRDITARKNLEQNLKSSEQRLRATLNSIEDAVISAEVDGKITRMNPAAERLTGWTARESVGRHLTEILHILDSKTRKLLRDPFSLVPAPLEPVGLCGYDTLISREGREFHVSISAAPVEVDEGALQGLVVVIRDDTREHEMRDQVLHSEQKFRSLFEQASDGLLIHDEEGRIQDVNQSMSGMFGYAKPEFLRFLVDDLKTPEGISLRQFTRGDQDEFEADFTRKDGGVVNCIVNSSLVQIGEGKKIRYLAFKDITARKRTEAQLVIELREKDLLLRELYHRTKNNMQVISAMIGLKVREIEDAKTVEILMELDKKILSMALVHQKLYETGNLSYLNLREYLGSLFDLFMDTFRTPERAIRFRLVCEDILVNIDSAVPLGQIISEWILNSMKHAFPDRAEGLIELDVRKEISGHVVLEYRDDGIGLPPGFNPETDRHLGLEMVFGLATEQLNGRLEILEAKEPGGMGFRLEYDDEGYGARV